MKSKSLFFLIVLAVVPGLGLPSAFPAFAQSTVQSPESLVTVIVSDLPDNSSAVYSELRTRSGAMLLQELPITNSEMWRLEQDQLETLKALAAEYGVAVSSTKIAPGTDLMRLPTPEQIQNVSEFSHAAFTEHTRKSAAVRSITTMAIEPPSEVEYALTRDRGTAGTHGAAGGHIIKIRLNENEVIEVRRRNVEVTKDKCLWHGYIEGSDLPVSLIWWPDGRMTGTFFYNGRNYAIRNIDGEFHAIVELDPSAMPLEHPPRPRISMSRSNPLGLEFAEEATQSPAPQSRQQTVQNAGDINTIIPRKQTDINELLSAKTRKRQEPVTNSSVLISVLFLYTTNASLYYSDITKDLVELAVEQTNQTFRNSGVENVRIRLAGSHHVDYRENNDNLFTHLWRLADHGDRHLEEVHGLRDETHADIVILILDAPNGCGLATRVFADASEAFAIVHHECATTTFSVAHEIGHIIGTRHDRSLDNSTQPFDFGFGYANELKWRTLMAYSSACRGCPRLPIWSSPFVKIAGEAAGDPRTHNARVIAEQAGRVAAFR